MICVHVAEHHRREIPEPILEAAQREADPDLRVLAMLGARGGVNVPIFEATAPIHARSARSGGAKLAQNYEAGTTLKWFRLLKGWR